MLALEEQKLYYWLTSHWADDVGAVVDLGCFVGGSTARLAAGHARACHKSWIHAYDRFLANERTKEAYLYRNGIAEFDGADTYWLARDLLHPWDDHITLHRGDIRHKAWDGDPIELLILDAAKSDERIDNIAETFFPHLIPGKSLVIQQDYYHWKLPWIPAQMQRMHRWFKPIAYCPDDTVIFLNTRQVDDQALAIGNIGKLTDAELLASLRRSNWRGVPWHKSRRIRKMIKVLIANPGVRIGHMMRPPDDSDSEM
ncbi:hypothetical protein [Aliiroseovarius sp. 2305UL8-7]|uniref:hypothetical protein n=1 Tax=Aliiroseovarius conchicola TaxID=3121637 RepID=UPI003527C448